MCSSSLLAKSIRLRRTILVWAGIAFVGAASLQVAAQEPSSPVQASPVQYRAVLDRYCVTCHSEKLKTAGLILSNVNVSNPAGDAEVFEKVVRKLRGRAMPPAGAPRPDNATYDSFAAYLERSLDRAAALRPSPGRPTAIHRLNRAEYTNAIRDLLAVEIDGASLLPADDSSYGFDNIGDVLSVSPLLMEGYMSAARKISRIAIGDPATRPSLDTYDIPKFLIQEDRMSEDLPFGSRGGIAVRHQFPVDGEYAIRIRLQRNSKTDIIGLAKPQQLDVRVDGARIKSFNIGGERGLPAVDAKQNGVAQELDAGLEVRIPVKAGLHSVGVTFMKVTSEPERPVQPRVADYAYAEDPNYGNYDAEPAVGTVSIGGPLSSIAVGETASRQKIFLCRPSGSQDEESCARRILSALSRRAYRRPVTDKDLQPLLSLFKEARSEGMFEEGIKTALQRILVDPQFLFRIERDPANVAPGTAYRVSDLELASRLSFFVWSSIPDDQLLDLAERGRLKDSATLQQQVRRMLADPRSKALVSNFFGQWLYLRNLPKVWADVDVFTDFDQNVRDAFQQETQLFLESMLQEDRPVPDMLSADYTFVNERLARHYGIRDIYGSHFRRIRVTDENRKGLLGQGSILLLTSYPARTAPTIRGKFLLENILGTPPPPPPANVPSLGDGRKDGKQLTMRQQMEEHRTNPACAACHKAMDPLGFALENFDATGKWRTVDIDGVTPIDASGVLPDGTKFQGPAELRKVLLSHPEQFVATLTQKLLTYSLGRGVEYYDAPAIRKVMQEAALNKYRWSSIILGIVKSVPFQMRRSQDTAALR